MPLARQPLAFSLRTLLVLVALLCAWLAWKRSIVMERREAREDWRAAGVLWFHPEGRMGGVRGLLGDQPMTAFWFPADCVPETLERAAALFPEAIIYR